MRETDLGIKNIHIYFSQTIRNVFTVTSIIVIINILNLIIEIFQ